MALTKTSYIMAKNKTQVGSYVKIKLQEETVKKTEFGLDQYNFVPKQFGSLNNLWIEGYVFDNTNDSIVLVNEWDDSYLTQKVIDTSVFEVKTNAISKYKVSKNKEFEKLEDFLNALETKTPITVEFKPGVKHIQSKRPGYEHTGEYILDTNQRMRFGQTISPVTGHIIRFPKDGSSPDFVLYAKPEYDIAPLTGIHRPSFVNLDTVKKITSYAASDSLDMD